MAGHHVTDTTKLLETEKKKIIFQIMKLFLIILISLCCLYSKGQIAGYDSTNRYKIIINYLNCNDSIKKEIKKSWNGILGRFHKVNFTVAYGHVGNFFKEDYFKNDSSNIEFKLNLSIDSLRQLNTHKKPTYILIFAGEYKNFILLDCIRYKKRYIGDGFDYSFNGFHYFMLFVFSGSNIIDVKSKEMEIETPF